jgi:drug/metabolite transporter (DMT)-like permease
LSVSTEKARLRLKSWLFAPVVVLANVLGNYFLKRGLPPELPTPFAYIAALFRPWAALGVALLILWLISRMALLSWADLSYVLPVTSVGYVLVALAGKVFLGESISPQRWVGIGLIVAGVALVGGATHPRTETPIRAASEERLARGRVLP